MTKEQKVFSALDKTGRGLEIGPSHNPLAPKKSGFRVDILDHMSREDLVGKYTGHSVNLANIEEVDYIWQGEPYAQVTGKKAYYDWIIASHLIEHTPDLITFLKDCSEILKEDGVLSLVIPDKRFCFDHFRPITGISKIIDSFFSKNKIHTAGTAAEYYLNVVAKGSQIAWDQDKTGVYGFVHGLNDAMEGMAKVQDEEIYLDLHAWCFTPHSFRLLIHDLNSLGFINLKEVIFYPTTGCEFYISLSSAGKGAQMDRLELLRKIEKEQCLT
jgi:SAM-dependent methyltransferase